jgi:hypothetical protein
MLESADSFGDIFLQNEKVENVHFVQIQKGSGEEKHGFQGRQGRKIHFVRFVGGKKVQEVLESGRVEEVGRKDIGGEPLRPALRQENKEIVNLCMEKSPERTAERCSEEPGNAAASL